METALPLVEPDPDVVDEAVGRAAGVGRPHPGDAGVEIRQQLVEIDRHVAVEVDEPHALEHVVVLEHRDVEQATDCVVDAVVGLPGLEDDVVDALELELRIREELFA